MRHSSPRTRTNVSAVVERRLTAYALAASAAGVGALSLAPAQAEVVYTPAEAVISLNNPYYFLYPAVLPYAHRAPFLLVAGFTSPNYYWDTLGFNPYTSGARFVRGTGSSRSIMPMKEGDAIGPGRRFGSPSRGFIATYGPYGGGTYFHHQGFQFGQTVYVGFKFLLNGTTHYGWARVTAYFDRNAPKRRLSTHLDGYAYESVPNKPILAGVQPAITETIPPKPSSLGALALGSVGLSIWRREQAEAEQ